MGDLATPASAQKGSIGSNLTRARLLKRFTITTPNACAAQRAQESAPMKFSAMAEGLCWGFPRMPGPGASALEWSRWTHAKYAVHKQNGAPPSKERFAINIEPALEHFRIQWPVAIWIEPLQSIQATGFMRTRAYYSNKNDTKTAHSMSHRLILADCLSTEETSACAWHELCHAAQNEYDHERGLTLEMNSRLYHAAFGPKRGNNWRRYALNEFEFEAYGAMNNHHSVAKLTLDN